MPDDAVPQGASSNGHSGGEDTALTPEGASDHQDTLETIIQNQLGTLIKKIGADGPDSPQLRAVADRDLAVELIGGPADAPSLHDFHSLQVAWEDVWTAMVDKELAREAALAYRLVVQVVGSENSKANNPEITELEEFLGELQESVETAGDITDEIKSATKPFELFGWLPGLDAKWDILKKFDQEQLYFFYWLDQSGLTYTMQEEAKEQEKYPPNQTRPSSKGNYSVEAAILQWDPGPPFAEDNGKFTALNRLWEIGQTHKDWLQVTLGQLYPGYGHQKGLEILSNYPPAPSSQPNPEHVAALVTEGLTRAKRLLEGIQTRLGQGYRFDVFQPNSHNFGVIFTYRQKWQPLPYQVGELVASIPLAPGEKRTYSKKLNIKTSRAQKEIEKYLSSRTGESTETTRGESEILRKASYSTNFKLTADGGFNIGIAHLSGGMEYATNQAAESSSTKKDFREAVRKAAHEYRNERSLEVNTEQEFTNEFVETGQISNENNELTVTYLFYELQRRFEISEQLYKLTPVVLFAFEVPTPDQIDEAWLLANEWILRRVLLDDGLLPALDYLSDTFAGDELAVEIHKTHWEVQMRVVGEFHENAEMQTSIRNEARRVLEGALGTVASSGGGGGLLGSVGDILFGSDNSGGAAVEARRQAAQKALEWAEADFASVNERLTSAVTALQDATRTYSEALERRLNRRVAIDQLRLHIKQNILYYMQAIWLHEPPDQRYLRIYNENIEWPEPVGTQYRHTEPHRMKLPSAVLGQPRKLHQVADIDNLLGFKGNYAIFPLRERNALTDFMIQDYLDDEQGIVDTDPSGEIPPPSEAIAIAKCALSKPNLTAENKKRIIDQLFVALENQRQTSEIIIVPTGQLFIEALPGAHPLLEDFKLKHRIIDVRKAQAEAHQAELEALRYAARINTGELTDPDVQTQIVASDPVGVTVNTPGALASGSQPNS